MDRKQAFLRERYKIISATIGRLLQILGVLYAVPILIVLFYPSEVDQIGGFLVTSSLLISIGTLLRRLIPLNDTPRLSLQEGAVIIVLVWIIAILSGTVPFMLNSGLTFPQAVFEAASGWTTTGLSVVDVTESSNSILFYRSFIQLIGGAGFAIITLSALTGSFGTGLMRAEGRTDQLEPHVRKTAIIVIRLYLTYIVAGILMLKVAGMNWFDAINHAFAALSTGGFSTRPESIGYWDSVTIEAVTIVLMLLGTVNFLTVYLIFRGKVRKVVSNVELRFMSVLIVTCVTLVFAMVTLSLYPSLSKSIRVALFEVVSAVTTTGFSTVGYTDWGAVGWLILILLMLIGGGTGSTAGGIKQLRAYILLKTAIWEIKRALRPNSMVNVPTINNGDAPALLSDEIARKTGAFLTLYMLFFVGGVFALVASGFGLRESLFEFASTLSTVGLSAGITSTELSVYLYWIMSIGMLLGRLEFITVLVGIGKIKGDLWEMRNTADASL